MLAEAAGLSQMSLIIVVGIIAAVCGVMALIRGAFRMIVTTALLAAALFVAYWVWVSTPNFGSRLVQNPPHWMPFVLPAVAGFFTFSLLRKIVRIVMKPFGSPGSPSSFVGKAFALILSIVPTSLLCLTGATVVRHIGSIEEIKNGSSTSFSQLKKTIDRYVPPAYLQRLDPLTDPSRLTLAKLVAMSSEQHIPRAIPVSEIEAQALREQLLDQPNLQKFAKDKNYAEILRDPQIDQALKDPRIQAAIKQMMK